MKISEMEFPANDSTKPFKLGDGHEYFVHRLTRDGKPTVYTLMAAEGSYGSFTPYISEHQMDSVLAVRTSKDAAAVGTLDPKSPTGYVCPGCGAVTTETGVHVGPANPAESAKNPGEPKTAVVDGQIELISEPTQARRSRFFDAE